MTNLKYFMFNIFLPPLAEENDKGLPWWAWLLIIIVVVLIFWLLWQWLRHPRHAENLLAQSTPAAVKSSLPPVAQITPAPSAAPAAVAPPVVKSSEPLVSAPAAAATAAPAPAAPVKPDDLTVVEGIGPKISSVLQAAGITTFSQLAEANLSRLDQILKDADLRLADPATWPEQSRLAAEGKWDELKVLQDNLKGGRRV